MLLAGGRVMALALVLQGAAAALLTGQLWHQHRVAAVESAQAAVRLLDERLAEIDDGLMLLAARVQVLPTGSADCTPELTQELLRASLDALHTRRVWLLGAGPPACGPQGATAAVDLPPVAPDALALVSRRSISVGLVAARRLNDGHVLAALLDPRALDLPTLGPWRETEVRGQQITLHSSDRRALSVWGARPDGAPLVSSLHMHQRSARYDYAVSVDIASATFLRAGLRQWPAAALLAALLAGAVTLWAWRRALGRARLGHRLEVALRKRQFEPWLQPIVDIASGRCVGGEVLMRWAHPERGIVGPGEFIDEAERNGLVVGMSELVMVRAAHRLAPLARAHPDVYFSFNITVAQLRHADFARQLAATFNADTLPREQVLLELTEREALDPLTQGTLRSLHAAGWRIAIDDFGTGQSSLAALERLPIDRLKIDRAFVSAVGEQTARRPVLDAIISLARELQLSLVAEGVETQAQWDYLAQRGVGSAQGYLIARPMELGAFTRWFEHQQQPQAGRDVTWVAVQPPGPAGQPLRDDRLASLWQRMCSGGGLDVRDRLYRLRTYRQCFVGREAVDWLVHHDGVSRAEALRIGRRFAALGWLRHVVDEHDFEDAELFYAVAGGETASAEAPPVADLRRALHATDGPAQTDHRRGLIRHRRCLRGERLIDWVVERYRVPRATALQWGAQLMREGCLRHVFDDRPLIDGAELYRLG